MRSKWVWWSLGLQESIDMPGGVSGCSILEMWLPNCGVSNTCTQLKLCTLKILIILDTLKTTSVYTAMRKL